MRKRGSVDFTLNGCLRLQEWNSEVMDVQTERGNVSCVLYIKNIGL